MSVKTLPHSVLASLSQEVLQQGGHFSFLIRGRSMTPALRNGDRVNIGPLQATRLSPGQLLVYRRSDGGVVIHRLMDIRIHPREEIYLVSPDTAPLCSEEVRLSQILGRVEKVFRDDRQLPLDSGWRLWWGHLLTVGFRHPWMLRILFRVRQLGHVFIR